MDHPITIAKVAERVIVTWRGRKVVDTLDALELKEADLRPVLYFPRNDADMTLMRRSLHETVCRYKGKANYFSLVARFELDDNAVWTYEAPKAEVESIAGRLAFYPDKVEIVREPGL